MEGDNFLEQFQNKDLSGVKKFNFKKAKATKVEEKDPPHLESNIESTTINQCQDKGPSKKIVYSSKAQSIPWLKKSTLGTKKSTINPPVSSKIASCSSTSNVTKNCFVSNDFSKCSPEKIIFKQNQTTSNSLSSKTSYLPKEEQKDSILDSLYKNTLSNKRGIDLDSPVLKNHSKPQSPNKSPNHQKISSKEVSSVSKYFSNETKKSVSSSPSVSPFKKILETKSSPLKCDKSTKPYSLDEYFHRSEKQDIQVGVSTSKPITISDSSSATNDSPVIKPKKFVFKKKTLGSSKDFSLSLENNSFDESTNQHKEPVMSTYDEVSYSNCNTALNTKSTSDNDLNKKNTKKELDAVSQSLEVTGEDYMDDEEFERQFGSLADQFDESMANETLTNNESQNKVSKKPESTENTEELLNEITNINWQDDLFEEEEIVETGFKDRDDDSKEFQGNYEHSEVMMEILHQKFGLRSFRPHQREIINASLTLHDCFVLMPTGGGKSLCYQLPAVLTPGVTVVVSPLRALISDQVDKLNALDIAAAHLCSDVSQKESEQIYHKLSMREPGIKLLYLTPEKINASRQIINVLDALYQRGKLARFVIDECHCLSAWGHDFRPDYKQLSLLRKNYKDVPIICLTATATKKVETDVINILGLKKVKRFIRSFNRPNIKYQVIPKAGKGTTEEIASLIKCKFPKMSGIVYCLGRKDCDLVAEEFNNLGIKSKPYHAGMNDKVREVIQREWMQDRFHVIVATIAFGMGIDKPDVRFVIHNSIPKSVEAFYQESGRAGRDGEVSYSYLYYAYGDAIRLLKLMQLDRNVTSKTMEAHKENLNQMVGFAENMVDCRRHLQLIHLGEHFDRKICMRNKATVCDNCENFERYKTIDVTKAAKQLCEIVKDLTNKENVTMLYVSDIYKGSKVKKIMDRGHNKHRWYGAGAQMDRNDIQRVLKQLLLKHVLDEFCTYAGDYPVVYLQVGSKFYQFYNNPGAKMELGVCTDRRARKTEAVTRAERAAASNTTSSGWVDVSKPSTSREGAAKPLAVQKQVPARLQAARKLQLVQLKTQCHEELLEECRRLAMERNLTLSSIMNLSAIKTMSENLPKTKEEMLKIQHVTNANYSKYGEFFLAITTRFRAHTDALAPLTELSSSDKDWGDKGIISDDDDDEEERSADFNSSGGWGGSRRGVKRKSSWRGKRKGGFGRGRKKSKTSPKGGGAKRASGWTSTSKRGGGKGLGLMPLHFK